MKRLDHVLVTMWVSLYSFGDVLTTTWLKFNAPTVTQETNPVAVFGFAHGGFWTLVALKLPMTVLVVAAILYFDSQCAQGKLDGNFGRALAVVMVGISAAVVANNVAIMATVK